MAFRPENVLTPLELRQQIQMTILSYNTKIEKSQEKLSEIRSQKENLERSGNTVLLRSVCYQMLVQNEKMWSKRINYLKDMVLIYEAYAHDLTQMIVSYPELQEI